MGSLLTGSTGSGQTANQSLMATQVLQQCRSREIFHCLLTVMPWECNVTYGDLVRTVNLSREVIFLTDGRSRLLGLPLCLCRTGEGEVYLHT